jgi:arylsulfatase A-like enzyme
LPHETGSLDAISLPAGVESLAELLEPEAYQRIAVVSNYVLHEGRGFEQGFEIYDDEMTDREQARDWPERIARRTTDRALELVRDRKQHQPLFMWIHYEDPHGPYTAPEPFTELFDDLERPPRPLRRLDGVSGYGGIPSYQQASPSTDYHRYVSRYDAEIRYLDHELGRFLDGLREMGLYEDSILILTSDHGEGMGEREYFFAHGESLHGSLLRVPLIIRHGQRLRGRRSDLVQHVDLVPTIRAMLGLAPDSRLRGRDLREPSERPVEVVSEMNSSLLRIGSAQSLVTQHWKLIRVPQSGRAALFDLEHDPQELNNLASDPEYADRLATLSGRLEDLRSSDRLGLTTSVAPPVLSEAERARLEALGYAR